jgi:hypothetical protein
MSSTLIDQTLALLVVYLSAFIEYGPCFSNDSVYELWSKFKFFKLICHLFFKVFRFRIFTAAVRI